MKNSFWAILFLLFPILAPAQKANFQFYTTADGLSGNYTGNVVQDDKGFIWILNDYKLHRYDGRSFVRYPLAPGNGPGDLERILGINIYEDSLLLLLTQEKLLLMDPQTDQWQPFPFPFSQSKIGYIAWSEYRKKSFFIIIYSEDRVTFDLWNFQDRQLERTNFENIPVHPELKVMLDTSGHMYAALGSQVIKRAPNGRQVATLSLDPVIPNGIIRHFQIAENGDLHFLTSSAKGRYRLYTISQQNPQQIVDHPVNRLLANHPRITPAGIRFDPEGNIWLAGADRQLAYYDAAEDTLYDFREELLKLMPNNNDVIYFIPDNTGTIWIPTRLGCLKVTLRSTVFDHYFDHPQDACRGYCSFRGITEDDKGNIYASFYNGLARLDPQTDETSLISFKIEDQLLPWGLSTQGNKVWLNNGQLLEPRSGTIRSIAGVGPFFNEAGLFSTEKNGRLWWVHNHELYHLDTVETALHWEKELELPYKGDYITEAIHAGPYSGKLWISHRGQLLQYVPDDGTQRWFSTLNWELPISRILVIEEAPDETLWMGTDIGLVHFDPASGQTKHYTEEDGLSNNFVCGMLTEGDSCLWLSTNSGLSRFHMADRSFINFYQEDGLTHNEFNRLSFFKARDGRMYFGGLRGINAFFPQELMQEYRRRNEAAQLVLSSFEYVDEKADTTFREYGFPHQPVVDLHYWHRSFTFEYALTDYRNPEEIYYSYQMEGYEDTWSTPSAFNFTRFSSLPAGKYVFRVKARDSHGLWHPNELAVQVTVHPPWWKTTLAYFIYFLIVLAIFYLIYYFMKRRLYLQNELKQQADEAKRLQELDAFKSRLYTNLTHEFRTPLTVILGMTGQIRSEPKKYLDRGTRLIETNGKNLLRLINQLLDLSKLEDQSFKLQLQTGDMVSFLRYVTESFQTYANSQNLSLRFFSTLESLLMDFDEEQMQHILTNLISNALKFTPPEGEVEVRLSKEDNRLKIEVRDNGIGIAAKDLPHVFDRFYQVDASATRQGEGTGIGLAHTYELVKLMGGTIEVESELGKGTRFLIRLPVLSPSEGTTDPEADNKNKYGPHSALAERVNSGVFSSGSSDMITATTAKTSDLPSILLIEDNADVVVYLKSCLSGLYHIQVAFNGRIGIETAFESIPDLVISDVMMPEKDGFEVCDTLKNDERTSHIPIILLTAKADAPSRITGLRRGADAYLIKPFDKEELLVRLEMLMERQQRMVAHFSNQLAGKTSAEEDEMEEALQIEDAFMQKIRQIVAEHYSDEDFSLPQLCQKIRMSRSQLYRKMQALSGISPSDFIRTYRLQAAKELLETTDLNVSEVAWQVGFKHLGHFSKAFQDEFGYPPSTTSK